MKTSPVSINYQITILNNLFRSDLSQNQLKTIAKEVLHSNKVQSHYKFQASKVLCSDEVCYSDEDLDISLNWGGNGQVVVINKKSAVFKMEGGNGSIYEVKGDLLSETETKTVELAQKVFKDKQGISSAESGASILNWIWSWCPKDKTSQFIRPPVTIGESQYLDLYTDDVSNLYNFPDIPLQQLYENFAASADALGHLGLKGVVYLDYKAENLLFEERNGQFSPFFSMTDFDGVVRIPIEEKDLTEAVLAPLKSIQKKERSWPPFPSLEINNEVSEIIGDEEFNIFHIWAMKALCKADPQQQLECFAQAVQALQKMQSFLFGHALLDPFLSLGDPSNWSPFKVRNCFIINEEELLTGFSIDALQSELEAIGGPRFFNLLKQLTNFNPEQRMPLDQAAIVLRELAGQQSLQNGWN